MIHIDLAATRPDGTEIATVRIGVDEDTDTLDAEIAAACRTLVARVHEAEDTGR